ncbi:S-adenosyl-L-methionine-dependent methyltransferase [Lipomyces japonicus]|uniref:S-adenosyl-L-methionine-dependent methyltransferase n=1 Tax=Lipomyces japonicus TaxID=56871 RepID=UPI0034CF9ED4
MSTDGNHDDDVLTLEQDHVHTVYNQIAAHFSQTRYKPWPVVDRFLKSQPAGAIGIDVGCGNGKYLSVNKQVWLIGSDRSDQLVGHAVGKNRDRDVVVSDAIELAHPNARFDFAISVAVIHHFATPARRIQAIKTMLLKLRLTGTALIYVWALEQKGSRRGWDETSDQDVMVPWVTKSSGDEKVFQRYYHLYRQGELESDVQAAGGVIVETGYERDNWYAIISRP